MKSMMRVGFVLAAMVGSLSGCNCNGGGTECSDLSVSFVTPNEGATVDAGFTATIEVTDSTGALQKFDSATLAVGGHSFSGTVTGSGLASFDVSGLDAGTQTLTASVTKGACGPDATGSSKINPATRTVTVKYPTVCTPKVTAVYFPQDTYPAPGEPDGGDYQLSRTELPPGTELQVRVQATACAGTQVNLQLLQADGGVASVGTLTDISSGTASVSVPVGTGDTGTFQFFAQLQQGGAAVNSRVTNPSGLASISLDRVVPNCTNTTKLLNGPSDDGNGTLAGFQLATTGLVPDGLTAIFKVTGQTQQVATPVSGAASATFTLPASGDTTYTVDLVCQDGVGNTATDTKQVRVDYLAPTVAITAPALDAGTIVVTTSPLDVRGTADADAQTACAYLGSSANSVACAPVSNGQFSIPVPFGIDGTYTVRVDVTDQAGNLGSAGPFPVTVSLTGCGLIFSRPAACPALITAAQVTNGNFPFQTRSNVTCAGQSVALTVTPVLVDGGLGSLSAVGSGTVAADGFAAVTAAVTSGDFIYAASVPNVGVDAGVSATTCRTTVDLDGPAITSPVKGQAQPYAIINALQDTQAGTPGAQRLLQFSARVPAQGHVDVCTSEKLDGSGTARPSGSCGTGYYVLQSGVSSPTAAFTFPEGQYSIKIVVIGGGTTVESAVLPLLVDVTKPCLLASSKKLPQDLNADGMLNIAELGASPPKLQFDLDSTCGDVDLATMATTDPIIVQAVSNGTPGGRFNLAADVSFAAPVFSVNLTQGVAVEKDYVFWVQLTDLAGNSSTYTGVLDPALFAVRVDKTAPSCDISTPSAAQTLLGQAAVPSGNFGVTVGTSADVPDGGVSITLAGPSSTTKVVGPSASNQANTTFPVTGTHAWTVDSTCTDQAGNHTSATTRSLTIDLDAPTCSISSPTSTSYTVSQIQTTLTVNGADGRPVSCSANGTALLPPFTVSGTSATQALTYPNGTLTVGCSVSDLAGNAGTCSVNNVVVNSTSCQLTIPSAVLNSNGYWLNHVSTGLGGASGTTSVTANTPNCGSMKAVTLVRTTPAGGTPVTFPTDTSGNVTFATVAVADGDVWTATIDNGAGLTTTTTFQVALGSIGLTSVAVDGTAVASGANTYFVATTGNVNIGKAGYFADQTADTNPATASAQFDLTVNGVTGGRVFGLDGTIDLLYPGATTVTQAVTQATQTFTFSAATVPHGTSGALGVRVTDAAGNQATIWSSPTVVDVIAPAAPQTFTQALTNARTGEVTLQWDPSYNDGTYSSSGGHAGYDVRWTTSSVPGNGQLASSALFFAGTSYPESITPWSGSHITRTLNLPPINTYYVSVRAFDAVGNYSTFVAPVALANPWSVVTLNNPGTSTDFGSTLAAYSSVVGDATPDLVVGSATRGNIGSVYVYTGSNSFANQASCGAGCQELTPLDGTGPLFGSDLSTDGNVGDDGTDATTTGVADVVVGQRGFVSGGTVGRVFVFLGTTASAINTTSAKVVEIRGDGTNLQIGWNSRIIKDLDGDGLDELAISAYLYGGGRGRLYIFKGRSLAAWKALNVSGQSYLLVTSADWIIEPDAIIGANPVNTSNGIGLNRYGFASLPGVTGGTRADGGVIPELVVPFSRANISRVVLFSGATIAASTGSLSVSDAGVADAGIQTLSQSPSASNSVFVGFGAATWGRSPVFGTGKADFFVSYPLQNTIYYYSNWGPSGALSGNATGTLVGQNAFGANINAGDLNGDGRADLLISEGISTANGAWLLYQKTINGPFDTPIGNANVAFQVSEFRVTTGTSKFGANSAVADIDGANGPDVILSDETAGIVRIWR